MAIGVTFPENEDVVTFWWKIERLVRVESKVDIYKKELGNYAGYRLRKVYWKDLHYWGMKISRDAVTHVKHYFLFVGIPSRAHVQFVLVQKGRQCDLGRVGVSRGGLKYSFRSRVWVVIHQRLPVGARFDRECLTRCHTRQNSFSHNAEKIFWL